MCPCAKKDRVLSPNSMFIIGLIPSKDQAEDPNDIPSSPPHPDARNVSSFFYSVLPSLALSHVTPSELPFETKFHLPYVRPISSPLLQLQPTELSRGDSVITPTDLPTSIPSPTPLFTLLLLSELPSDYQLCKPSRDPKMTPSLVPTI